jgi:DeoR family suf operon transcriptional repressor
MKLIGSKWTILRLINKKETVKVSDLEEVTDLGITTLREHLEDLESRGLVDYEKKSEGRGRPKHIYFLTDRAKTLFPSPNDSLSKILFKVLKKSLTPEEINRILRNTLIDYLDSTNQQIQNLLEEHGELNTSGNDARD